MNPYLPHTDAELREMLSAIGLRSLDQLFDDIPEEIRMREPLHMPRGLSEWEVAQELARLASLNDERLVSFMGGGSYDHLIPAVVRHVLARPELATAYTPYQPEISQGLLQAIFEFQTMMCLLTGLDVANASLYDGASAVVEGCSMALASRRGSDTLLYSKGLHPHVQAVLRTNFEAKGVRLVPVPMEGGATSRAALRSLLGASTAAVVVQTPNLLGCLEDYEGFADAVHSAGALFVISANPLALALLKSPAEWGADIAVGDTQPLGCAQSFGGPSAGYITARFELLRKMPGRIVGESRDRAGRRAYVLTLQAREQHIKRERATSNICTNQALVAVGNASYLAAVGESGFKEICLRNCENAQYLHDSLCRIPGVRPLYERPFFNEFTLRMPVPARVILPAMSRKGFLAGISPEMMTPEWRKEGLPEEALTIAATEKRTKQEMDAYVSALKESLDELR